VTFGIAVRLVAAAGLFTAFPRIGINCGCGFRSSAIDCVAKLATNSVQTMVNLLIVDDSIKPPKDFEMAQ
jgi:hypothetical protein